MGGRRERGAASVRDAPRCCAAASARVGDTPGGRGGVRRRSAVGPGRPAGRHRRRAVADRAGPGRAGGGQTFRGRQPDRCGPPSRCNPGSSGSSGVADTAASGGGGVGRGVVAAPRPGTTGRGDPTFSGVAAWTGQRYPPNYPAGLQDTAVPGILTWMPTSRDQTALANFRALARGVTQVGLSGRRSAIRPAQL